MKKAILCLWMSMMVISAITQPYLDIINFKQVYSPDIRLINNQKREHTLTYSNIGFNVPVACNLVNGIAIISPFYENWKVSVPGATILSLTEHQNFGLSLYFMDTVSTVRWGYMFAPIVRMKNFSEDGTSSAQLGVVGLAIFHKNPRLTYKFGLYFNRDYFGDYFIPLAGIDWWINERDKIFGILPGSLNYEHRRNKYLYYGICFNAITNSYRDLNAQYFRVDDNQLGIYTDINILKHTVLNFEIGHSIGRRLILGEKNIHTTNLNVGDNMYAKISVAYRMRFVK